MCMFKPYGFTVLLAIPVLLILLLSACSVEQTISIEENLSGRWISEGRAQGFAGNSLDDLALLGGYNDAAELYNGAIIEAQSDLTNRSSVESATVELTGPHSWKADIRFTNLEELLGAAEGNGIAEIEQNGNAKILHFRFDRSRSRNIETLIPILTDPALSIFNPASTENLSEESYITDILGFTFGRENLPAIRASRVRLDLSLPGTIIEVRGGRKIGNDRVRFEAPLTGFLVPEKNIDWMVSWSSGG